MHPPAGSALQPLRLRQFGLPFVERPEAVGFEFERAGDVQAVERAHSEFLAIAAAEVGAEVEGVLGQRSFKPNPCVSVASQVVIDGICVRRRNSAKKDLLGYGMEEFRGVKRTEPNGEVQTHRSPRRCRMYIQRVERYQEAAVNVGRQ